MEPITNKDTIYVGLNVHTETIVSAGLGSADKYIRRTEEAEAPA
jgi:hypothetical protein